MEAAFLDGTPGEAIIEVGAGLGVLTAELAKQAHRVVAVEVDRGLAGYLERRLAAFGNVAVVCADVLALSPAQLLEKGGAGPPYAVVGNLPYNIGAPVLRHFLESDPPPTRLVVMLQREVAESVASAPGRMSLLGVSVQLYGSARLLFGVPPRAFYPPPKVRSAVVRVDVAPSPRADIPDRQLFFEVVRAGFSAPRKQLRNALAQGLAVPPAEAAALLEEAGVAPTRRPQELRLEEWAALSRAWTRRLPGP